MENKNRRLKYPNYLLTKYQNEIYRQLAGYIKKNNLSQKQVAKQLGVSTAYVSQILNGNFNFTLKKLIELGLMIGKVPSLEFIEPDKYWEKTRRTPAVSAAIALDNSFTLPKTPKKKVIYFKLGKHHNHFEKMSVSSGSANNRNEFTFSTN